MTHDHRARLGLILCIVCFHGSLLHDSRAQSFDADRLRQSEPKYTHQSSAIPRLGRRPYHAWDLPAVTAASDPGEQNGLRSRSYELFSARGRAAGNETLNEPNASPSLTYAATEPSLAEQDWENFSSLDTRPNKPNPELMTRIWNDHLHYYSADSLVVLGSGLAVGGLIANTSLDADIQRHLQSSLRHANTDDWLETLHADKELGNGVYTLPVFAGAWIVGNVFGETRAGEISGRWGERSLRGFLVGAPSLIALQLATGASRPGESTHGSEWEPFQDNNGISGHAFMGALPFITAAKMTDSAGLKVLFYSASTLAPLSRAGENAHYPSQVALGWWMAYVAASAVHATDHPDSRWRVFPTSIGNGSGLAVEYRF